MQNMFRVKTLANSSYRLQLVRKLLDLFLVCLFALVGLVTRDISVIPDYQGIIH